MSDKEVVAWLDCWGEPHRTHKDAMYSDESNPAPLVPQSLLLEARAQIDALEAKLTATIDLQRTGDHPAPCARVCEATAFQIEIRQLKAQIADYQNQLVRMTAQMEVFDTEIAERDARIKELEAERDDYKAELTNILHADYRKWDAEVATAEKFVSWAKSRADFTLRGGIKAALREELEKRHD